MQLVKKETEVMSLNWPAVGVNKDVCAPAIAPP